jgi:hypothetical protein
MFELNSIRHHRILSFTFLLLLCGSQLCPAQDRSLRPAEPAQSQAATAQELRVQVRELYSAVLEMREQMNRLQKETEALREELGDARAESSARVGKRAAPRDTYRDDPPETAAAGSSPALPAAPVPAPREAGLPELEEDLQLLEAKVDDQYQTKVGSSSKYRIRLSGMALLNVFGNRGSVDNMDVPGLATKRGTLSTNASFGATVRQTMVGLEVFGPSVAGAKTRGGVQMDFFGGFTADLNGAALGVMRVRTATLEMDWSNTSLVAGLDTPFFSPLSPSSLATMAEPAFSYSGNLWTWTPQIRVEHHVNLSDVSSVRLQAGILDPLSGEPPYNGDYRYPQAGERSGQPAYATRIAWASRMFGSPMTIGVGGYYSRQYWGFNRKIDGWAGTVDWDIPFSHWVALSGEFYRGRAVGGLGGGIGRSVIYNGPLSDITTTVLGLDSVGGWGQLKFRPTERLEFNGAFGQDNPFAEEVRRFYPGQSYYDASLARNRSSMANVIFRPRSNLLLSLEYRRLWTYDIDEAARKANHLNLGIGILF